MTTGRVRGGFNQFGFTVGILMLDTHFPRIPGDMGNASTFPFPVRYQRVTGAIPDLVVRRGAAGLLPAFVESARQLEREGVGAITTNCGFLVKYQSEIANSVAVPVFTSSLLLVPLVHRLLPRGKRVGIMTVSAPSLTQEHLDGAGIGPDIPTAVAGMETEKEFTRVMLGNEMVLDVDACPRSMCESPVAWSASTRTSARSCWSAPTCRHTPRTSSARPGWPCSTSSRS